MNINKQDLFLSNSYIQVEYNKYNISKIIIIGSICESISLIRRICI